MTTTHTIDTTAAAASTLVITDDKHLTDLVHEAASIQLLLNSAEVKQQAHVEAAKKAFDEATREHTAKISTIFAAIEAYCAQHRDRLFPLKGTKRSKTYAVLQHKLQYRSSTTVSAPKDIVKRIQALLSNVRLQLASITNTSAQEAELLQLQGSLESLLRTPPQEFNKEAPAATLTAAPQELGISITSAETFKLAFTFTPDQAAA